MQRKCRSESNSTKLETRRTRLRNEDDLTKWSSDWEGLPQNSIGMAMVIRNGREQEKECGMLWSCENVRETEGFGEWAFQLLGLFRVPGSGLKAPRCGPPLGRTGG